MVFDRKKYKTDAKLQLKGNVGKFLPVVLITFILIIILNFIELIAKDVNYIYLLTFIVIVMISSILKIANIYYFLQVVKNNNIKFDNFLDGMNLWLKGILSTLWQSLWITIWSFFFIIPGIIKSIAYSQMDLIIADNPNISVPKAMKLSMAMTKGYKSELFILSLSFLGWFILGTLTCGIAFVWIYPYIQLTYTNTYFALKRNALTTGILQTHDFN